jgi:hypothetical protein
MSDSNELLGLLSVPKQFKNRIDSSKITKINLVKNVPALHHRHKMVTKTGKYGCIRTLSFFRFVFVKVSTFADNRWQ